MKKIIYILFICCFGLLFYQCENKNKETSDEQNKYEQEAERINLENKRAFEEAQKLQFNDSVFLKTKQPMSDQAIAPYDYKTGKTGDNAYNRRVYLEALKRTQKKLILVDNKLALSIKSGAEVNIAEDLFEYIKSLYNWWNELVEEGKFEIIINDDGYYDIIPIIKEKTTSMSNPLDLRNYRTAEERKSVLMLLNNYSIHVRQDI